MKKLVMFLAASAVAMGFAVKSNAQLSVGFGYASESVIDKTVYKLDEGEKGKSWDKDFSDLDGFYIEAAYNWEFMSLSTGSLSLQPGLRYTFGTQRSSKGHDNYKGDDYSVKSSSKSKISNHVLDIPVNVKYSYDFIPGALKAYAFAGPVFSIGLACNSLNYIKSSVTVGGETSQENTQYNKTNLYTGKYVQKYWDSAENKLVEKKDNGDKSLAAFDLKLGLGLGMTVSEKIDVKFGYNIGLLNRAAVKEHDGDKYKVHSNVLWFGVAYNF